MLSSVVWLLYPLVQPYAEHLFTIVSNINCSNPTDSREQTNKPMIVMHIIVTPIIQSKWRNVRNPKKLIY